jgi:endonuclease/exonuclease/phosphatase family metal-dependent hydrolase
MAGAEPPRQRRRPWPWVAVAAMSLLATGLARAEEVPPSRPLRFVTLNVLHGGVLSGWNGNGQHLDERLDMVTRGLRNLAPDVIALQEASRGRSRGHVAARLAERLGMTHAYVSGAFRFFGHRWLHDVVATIMNFEEGPAILSRFPIARSEQHGLPSCGRRFEPRALLIAELSTPWGPLTVASTHTAGDACHTRHVATLIQERRGDTPAVVMGDFNAAEGSAAIRALTGAAGFVDAFRTANPDEPGHTVWQPVTTPHRAVRRRVDYVFLVPGRRFAGSVVGSRVVVDTPRRRPDGSVLWPSDHYGVLAELSVFPPPGMAAPGRREAGQDHDRARGLTGADGLAQDRPRQGAGDDRLEEAGERGE